MSYFNKLRKKVFSSLALLLFTANIIFNAFAFAGTQHIEYGYISSAPDGTTAANALVRVYHTLYPNEVSYAVADDSNPALWWKNVGADLPTQWQVGDDHVVLIDKEINSGTANRKGYYAVTNKNITNGNDEYLNTLRPIPIPVATPGNNQVSLSWNVAVEDPGDPIRTNVVGYMVLRSTSPLGPYTFLATVEGSTSYVDNTAVNGTTYYYVLQLLYRVVAGTRHTSLYYSGNSNPVTPSSSGTPTIVAVNPSSAYRGDTLNVVITGSNTNFVNGVSTVNFGSGITVNSVSVSSPTQLTANITINTSAATGARTVTVTTGSESAVGTNIFTINAPSISINPSSAEQGWTGNISVSGTGTHLNGVTVANISGSGVTINSLNVTSPTTATINITVASTASTGPRILTLSTNLGSAGVETVSTTLTINPSSSPTGLVIDDYEYYAGRDHRGMMDYYYQSGSGVNEVTIGSPVNSTTVVQEGLRSIQITYPGASGTQWGGYFGGGLASETKDLTPYTGISLWVKGDGTNNTFSIGLVEADVSGVAQETYTSPIYSLSDTNWRKIEIPFSAFVRDAYGNQLEGVFSKVIKGYTIVYRGSQVTTTPHYIDYIVAENVGGGGNIPQVTGVNPNSGVNTGTTNVSISGLNFEGVTAVRIGTWPVSSYVVNSATLISAVIPAGLPVGTYYVTVTNTAGTSSQTPQSQFTVLAPSGDVMIDNFEENYRTDARGQMDYYFASGAQAGEVTIPDPINSTTNVYEGQKSMQITYPGASGTQWGGYWGGGLLNPNTDAIDVSSTNMIVYHVKGDGSQNTNRISITEYKNGTQDESFRALDSYTLSHTSGFKEIKVPYTRFWRDEYPGAVKDDNVFSNKIKSYTLVYTGNSSNMSSHYVDLIKAINWTGPIIDLIGPNYGPVGITVEVIGRNFGSTQGIGYVTLNGLVTPIVSWSNNRIVIVVPSGATSGLVEVTANGLVSNGVPFTVTGVNPSGPRINTIVPNVGPAGTIAVINGTGFLSDPGVNNRSTASYHVTIGTYRITTDNVLSWSDTSITIRIPSIPDGTYPVQVRANDIESNFVNFTVGSSIDTEPPSQVFGNSMIKSGSNLILGWQPATDNVGVVGYNIYRSTDPSFVPSPSNKIGTSSTTSYVDVGALTSPQSYYYKVKAFDAAGNESVNPSNIGYKLNKELQFVSGRSNIYWLAIPNITPYKKASDIAVDIPNCILVSRLNPQTQKFEDYFKTASGAWLGVNFNVTTGESYAVVISANSQATLVGWHIPYQINMKYNHSLPNVNWLSIPYNSVYTNAASLAAVIPNVILISRFNSQTQQFEDYFKTSTGMWIGKNFNINPGEGYSVVIDANSSWTPQVGP